MFGVERRNRILGMLHENKSVLVNEVALTFSVTEETIRRDLRLLERQNLILRTHGGAVLLDKSLEEAPLYIREGINIQGKDAIGREAAKLVGHGDTLLLDASTSSLFVAKHIKNRTGLTVITNAQSIVTALAECSHITLISTGGVLRHNSMSYVGHAAENALKSYYAGILFLSSQGFSPDRGLTDSNEAESEMKKVMLAHAKRVVFLCDHTKFEKTGYVTTAEIGHIDDIITDVPLPKGWTEHPGMERIQVKVSPYREDSKEATNNEI